VLQVGFIWAPVAIVTSVHSVYMCEGDEHNVRLVNEEFSRAEFVFLDYCMIADVFKSVATKFDLVELEGKLVVSAGACGELR